MADLDFVSQLFFRDWWKPYVGAPVVFEYLGNPRALSDYVSRRSIAHQIARVLGRKLSIASIINELIDIDLLGSKDKETILEEIIDLYEKYNAQKTLMEWFSKEVKRAATDGRLFSSISKHTRSTTPIFETDLTTIDSKFVTLRGAVCRKEHLSENVALYDELSHSSCSWVLCDFPPIGMRRENPDYKGQVVFLALDDGFDSVFGGRVPFDAEIGWFPFCTVAGFLNSRRLTSEQFPTLAMSVLIYERFVSPEPHVDRLKAFLVSEKGHRIWLDSVAARVLLYYLVPTMYRSWQIGYERVDPALKELLHHFFAQDRQVVSQPLRRLYDEKIFSVAQA